MRDNDTFFVFTTAFVNGVYNGKAEFTTRRVCRLALPIFNSVNIKVIADTKKHGVVENLTCALAELLFQ